MNENFLSSEQAERFAVPGTSHEEVLLNPFPAKFLLLHAPSHQELREAIEEYVLIRADELWNEALVFGGKGSKKSIAALRTTNNNFYMVSHSAMKALMGGEAVSAWLPKVLKLTPDEQRGLVAPLKPKSAAELLVTFPDRSYDRTGYRYLMETLEQAPNSNCFFEALLSCLFSGFKGVDYSVGNPKPGFHQARILEFLALSVRKGWLLFPFLSNGSGDPSIRALLHRECSSRILNPRYGPVEMVRILADTNSIVATNTTGTTAARFIERLFVCSTYRAIEHSSTEFFQRCVQLAYGAETKERGKSIARKGYNALLKLHSARCSSTPKQPLLYYTRQRETLDSFVSFPEVKDPQLAAWKSRLTEYLKSKTLSAQSLVATRTHCLDILKFLQETPVPPLRPELTNRALINDFTDEGSSFRNYIRKRYSADTCNTKLNEAAAFFSFVQDRLRLDHRDPTTDPPWFQNPVDIRFDRFSSLLRSGTTRKAIAAEIMAKMREVLVENDYAWSKRIESEWVQLVNGDTNELENVWCPSATLLLYTLLTVPLRGLQARLLDSGEGDAEIFDFETGQMIRNPRQLSVDGRKDASRKEGFIQIMDSGLPLDPHLVGLWISTNKTSEDGYSIPWVSEELRKHLKYQRDWIIKYTRNPEMHGIDEAQGHRNTPTELIKRESKFYCLFRDPSTRTRESLPVSKQKLRKLWGALCLEVEIRINSRAVDQFQRVKLVKIKEGAPESIYDIHTLRVSGITDLLDRGVPLNIVSEYVAGHATYMMTLWYDSPTLGAVRRALTEAQSQIGELNGLLPRLSEAEIEQMRPFLIGSAKYEGMYTGFDALIDNAGLVQVRQAGICPGTRCEEGGLTEFGRIAPVPVGDRGPSCPQCRFFLTGPAFLLGQAIEGNQLILKIRNKVGSIANGRKQILDAQDAGDSRKATLLADQSELEERQLNHMLTEWWHRMQFYESSIQRLGDYRATTEREKSEDRRDIVLIRNQGTSELNFGFRQASELELKHFISTCTEILPNMVNESLGAHQDIELAIGRFLAINEQDELTSMFFKLDADQRLSAANLMLELVNRAASAPIEPKEILEGAIKLNMLPSLGNDFSKLLKTAANGRASKKRLANVN